MISIITRCYNTVFGVHDIKLPPSGTNVHVASQVEQGCHYWLCISALRVLYDWTARLFVLSFEEMQTIRYS